MLLVVLEEAKVPLEDVGARSREILLAIVTFRVLVVAKVETEQQAVNIFINTESIITTNRRGRSVNGRSEKPLAPKHRLLL